MTWVRVLFYNFQHETRKTQAKTHYCYFPAHIDRSCMPQEPPAPDVPSPRLPRVSQRHRGWRKVRIFAVLDVRTNIFEVSLLLHKYDRGSLLRKRMTRSYIFFMFSQENNKLMFLATFLLPTRPQWSQVSTSQMLKQNKSDKTDMAQLQRCLHVQFIYST